MVKLLRKRWIAFPLSIMLVAAACMPFLFVTAAGGKTVTVTKTLIADDIHWDHGVPTFIFELETIVGRADGTAKYCAVISFPADYVSANTEADGTVSRSVTIEDIAPDYYELTERDALRYVANEVTDVVNGVVFPGYWTPSGVWVDQQSVEIDLKKNDYAAATFHNAKTNWADASHADCVINHISIVEP